MEATKYFHSFYTAQNCFRFFCYPFALFCIQFKRQCSIRWTMIYLDKKERLYYTFL